MTPPPPTWGTTRGGERQGGGGTTVFIPGTPLKTTHQQKDAWSIQNSIQDPGTRGYWWWKTADSSHSARTAHSAPPESDGSLAPPPPQLLTMGGYYSRGGGLQSPGLFLLMRPLAASCDNRPRATAANEPAGLPAAPAPRPVANERPRDARGFDHSLMHHAIAPAPPSLSPRSETRVCKPTIVWMICVVATPPF